MTELIWLAIVSSTITYNYANIYKHIRCDTVFTSKTSTGIVESVKNYKIADVTFYKAEKLNIEFNENININFNLPLCTTCNEYPNICSFDNDRKGNVSCHVKISEGSGIKFCPLHKKHGEEYKHK